MKPKIFHYLLCGFVFVIALVGCRHKTSVQPSALFEQWKDWYSPYSPYYLSTFAIDRQDNKWVACQGDTSALRMLNASGWHYFQAGDPTGLDIYFERIYDTSERTLWKGKGVVIDLKTGKHENKSYRCWQVYNIAERGKSAGIKEDQSGVLWEAADGGVRSYDGQQWKWHGIAAFQGSFAGKVAFDNEGNLLVSNMPLMGDQGYIVRKSGNSWTKVLECLPTHWVPVMLVDKQNVLWAGVLSRATVGNEFGLGLHRGHAGKWSSYTISDSNIPSNSVIEISEDKKGRLWIGTYSGGIACFDKKSKWEVVDNSNSSLPYNSVEFIEFDQAGDLWMGIQFNGIAQMKKVNAQ